MINILPTNDIKEHTEDSTCKCRPSVEILENGELMIIHNSFDGREAYEKRKKICNVKNNACPYSVNMINCNTCDFYY